MDNHLLVDTEYRDSPHVTGGLSLHLGHYIALDCTGQLYRTTVQCSEIYCNTLYYTIVKYSTVLYIVLECSTLSTMLYGWAGTVLYCTELGLGLYCTRAKTVLYCTVLGLELYCTLGRDCTVLYYMLGLYCTVL